MPRRQAPSHLQAPPADAFVMTKGTHAAGVAPAIAKKPGPKFRSVRLPIPEPVYPEQVASPVTADQELPGLAFACGGADTSLLNLGDRVEGELHMALTPDVRVEPEFENIQGDRKRARADGCVGMSCEGRMNADEAQYPFLADLISGLEREQMDRVVGLLMKDNGVSFARFVRWLGREAKNELVSKMSDDQLAAVIMFGAVGRFRL
jgi:hypothetical protein